MPDFDLIIRNGTIVDGTGAPGRPGDVAVRDGQIAAAGEVRGEARRVIDATGRVVAPGFIDVHAHDDAAAVRHPELDFKIMQGVTTDVVGNCGAGVAPANDMVRGFYPRGLAPILGESDLPWTTTAEYFKAVAAARPACNIAAYVPHGVVRCAVMGLDRRPPTDEELAQMDAHVDEGMRAGAIGLSTGLIYPPGSSAETEELIALARVAARHGGIYTSHIRNEGAGLLGAVEEALRIGRESGAPVQISHHKSAGPGAEGGTVRSLALIDEARAAGLDVSVDVYPYVASSSSLAAMARAGGERVFDAVPAIIASVRHNTGWEGRYVQDIAKELGLTPAETVQHILREEDNAPSVIMFIMDEDDVRRVMRYPHAMAGSDGLPTTGKPHPRLYGTMAAMLGRYVRDEALMPLEEAVRKMTLLPAAKHRIARRGALEPGWHADIVVFDPVTIADVATYDEPRRYPTGIECVVVNGQVAAEAGRQTEARAGRMLAAGR